MASPQRSAGHRRHYLKAVDGFHGFEVKRGIEDPNRFMLVAEWDSVEAHQAWQRDNVGDFVGALNDYLAKPPEISHFQ